MPTPDKYKKIAIISVVCVWSAMLSALLTLEAWNCRSRTVVRGSARTLPPVPAYWKLHLASKGNACVPDATVTVVLGGRLGNRIMEYASVWSMAKLLSLPAFVPDDISIQFRGRFQGVFQNLSVPRATAFLEEHCGAGFELQTATGAGDEMDQYEIPLEDIVNTARSKHKLIVLPKWVNMFTTIVPVAHLLREEFRYLPTLEENAQQTLWRLREQMFESDPGLQVTYVGVHVRRTDYEDLLQMRYRSVDVAGVGYYRRAVDHMRRVLSGANVLFVVVSDDPQWCQSVLIPQLGGPQGGVLWGGQGSLRHPEPDLALLSSCNHSIIAYGTFGTWAALMAGGHTVVWNITASKNNAHVDKPTFAMRYASAMERWVAL